MITKLNYLGMGLQGTFVQNGGDGEVIFSSHSHPRDQSSDRGGTRDPY